MGDFTFTIHGVYFLLYLICLLFVLLECFYLILRSNAAAVTEPLLSCSPPRVFLGGRWWFLQLNCRRHALQLAALHHRPKWVRLALVANQTRLGCPFRKYKEASATDLLPASQPTAQLAKLDPSWTHQRPAWSGPLTEPSSIIFWTKPTRPSPVQFFIPGINWEPSRSWLDIKFGILILISRTQWWGPFLHWSTIKANFVPWKMCNIRSHELKSGQILLVIINYKNHKNSRLWASTHKSH